MAYARHALLQFGGKLGAQANNGGGVEEWSCGIRVAYDNPGRPDADMNPDEQDEYLNDTAREALVKWFTSSGTKIAASASLEYAKFNAIGPNGKYVNDQTSVLDISGVVGAAADSGGMKYPTQVSLAATFTTNVSRGRAKLGRIYIPAPRHTLSANGTIPVAELEATAESTAELIRDLDNDDVSMGIRFTPVVASGLPGAGSVVGAMNPIQGVRVDGRFDIQRRRANGIIAVRAFRGLTE